MEDCIFFYYTVLKNTYFSLTLHIQFVGDGWAGLTGSPEGPFKEEIPHVSEMNTSRDSRWSRWSPLQENSVCGFIPVKFYRSVFTSSYPKFKTHSYNL